MPLTVAAFFGTPCILYYTLYSLKETLRDQCTPTQKVMLLLFIINPLIQENTNNVVKGTSNEAFLKSGLIDVLCKLAVIVKKNLIE